MKVAVIDIETSPALAHVWTLWGANVSLAQLLAPSRILSFAWKWEGESTVEFFSEYHDGPGIMLDALHERLSEADAVVTWNGIKFDMRHIRKELLLAGYPPLKPPAQIDLLPVVRKEFAFQSNKLDYVASVLLGKRKVSHEGHMLWVKCLEGDERAWDTMRRYNIGDVRLTSQVYRILRPYVVAHPSPALRAGVVDGRPACNRCGKHRLQKRGYAYTKQGKFQQYQCQAKGCGAWSRGTKRIAGVTTVGVPST